MGLSLIFVYFLLRQIYTKWYMQNDSCLICFQTPVLNPNLCWRSDKRGKRCVEQDGWREHRVEWLGRCPDSQLELVKWWSGRGGSKYWELSLAGRSGPVPACSMCLEKKEHYSLMLLLLWSDPTQAVTPVLIWHLKEKLPSTLLLWKSAVDVGRWHHRDRCASFILSHPLRLCHLKD